MKKFLILTFLLLSVNQAFCQESEKDLLDKFFEMYRTNSTEALDYIYGTNKWVSSNADGIKQLKIQIKQYEELVGDFYGEEFIYRGSFGENFVIYIYIVKYERQPFRFTFKFYKPDDKWFLYAFKFDDEFDDDFEEIVKYEYMRGN